MEAFVYRWRNQKTREWYIGYHKGTADDGYICSSRIARPRIQREPTLWTRKILRWGSHREMIELERRLLTRLQARTNPLSLNRSNGNGTEFAGRLPGTLNPHQDLLGKNLKKLNAAQLIDKMVAEKDPYRRFLIHRFIFNLVTEQKSKKPDRC